MTVVSLNDKIAYMDAELMELADMQDLGSCAAGREGSSPSFRSYSRKQVVSNNRRRK